MVGRILSTVIGVVLGVVTVLGVTVLAAKLMQADPKEAVYGCVGMDESKYLAYERHVFNSSPMLRARSTLNGQWFDIAVPKIALSGCFTEPGIEMQ